ncbi:MAG: TIM barrel protein [Phycisphaerae bacterium]|nr:TIM barrel protein [Phycisphaerae bacterium]
MKLSRRDFLRTSSGLALSAAAGLSLAGCQESQRTAGGKVRYRYAMCNESMQSLPWAEQCTILADAGYAGIEIAPFTLVQEDIRELTSERRKEMVRAMKDCHLECAGLHWLLVAPPKDLHFTTPDVTVREKTVAYVNLLIDFCGDMGGKAMIFGSPKQRGTQGNTIPEAKKIFSDGLARVADHAQKRGVRILIEPLDKTQTDVVNTTAEAVEIVTAINHPAIQTMFDFHNTKDETDDFVTLLKKYRKFIQHVHVMEMDGKHLGTGNAVNDYVAAFQYLKNAAYDEWVSLEVFDFSPGGKTIAEESMKVLKQIEAKLV